MYVNSELTADFHSQMTYDCTYAFLWQYVSSWWFNLQDKIKYGENLILDIIKRRAKKQILF